MEQGFDYPNELEARGNYLRPQELAERDLYGLQEFAAIKQELMW